MTRLADLTRNAAARGIIPDQTVIERGAINSKRVLHILDTAEQAGTAICKMVEDLATGIDGARYQVHVCFLRRGERLAHLYGLGIPATCMNWNGSPTDLPGAARYARLLRSAEFSIIHQHTG